MVGLDPAKKIVRRAVDLGVNFFDTADVYSDGYSERVLGNELNGMRKDVVIATKVGNPIGGNPKDSGLSEVRIRKQMAQSLSNLRTSYVDLYQIHRWDYSVPIEKTLAVLSDLVDAGKASYVGASSMFAWQFMQSLCVSEKLGLKEFVSMQPLYNLVYREEEREMIPLCRETGVALLPYSPLARGFLTGKYRVRKDSVRSKTDKTLQRHLSGSDDYSVLERLLEVASEKGVKPAQVALSWLLSKPWITAPIIGATTPQHIEDAAEAIDVRLSPDDVGRLEEAYRPHALYWVQQMRASLPEWFSL